MKSISSLIGTRRTPEPEIDAAGKQRLQCAELLGDDQRGMVGQHDAASADPDPAGGPGDMGNEDGGCCTGDTGHAVVFCQPIAVEPPTLGVLGQIQ